MKQRRHPTRPLDRQSRLRARRAPGRAWSRRAGYALLAAFLTLVQTTIGPLGQSRVAVAETRPYNTALLVASDTGLALDSVVTDGTTLAWLDTRGAIYTRTLADGREARILDGPARRSQLAIGGGVLVWVERGTDGVALRGLRPGSGDPFTIATGAGERNSPAISGNTVVWRDARAGGWQILVTISTPSATFRSRPKRRRAARSPSAATPSSGKNIAATTGISSPTTSRPSAPGR